MLDTNQWYTPVEILHPISHFFREATGNGGWFDPCCSTKSVAFRYATDYMDGTSPDMDSLISKWPNGNVYDNPPYSNVRPHVDAYLRWIEGSEDNLGIMLVNSSTASSWWQDLANHRNMIAFCFVAPRIKFLRTRLSEEEIRISNSKKKEEDLIKLILAESQLPTISKAGDVELVQPPAPRYESTIFLHGHGSCGLASQFRESFSELGFLGGML